MDILLRIRENFVRRLRPSSREVYTVYIST